MKKKKHVTVPRIHNPGKGRPAETLAYLSPIEHEMIRKMTDGTWERGPGGIRSYADDSASSNGVSRGDNAGTKGSGGLGGGNKGSGGNAGGSKASGSPNSGTSTGGTSASKSGSQSQSSSTTGAGGQRGAGSNYGPGSARPGAPSTALGQASQAAQQNAARASGTSTQWGGRSYSSPQTAGNGSYYGPKGGNALNTDARMAAARSVGFSQPSITRTPGDAEMLGRMMMAESSIIKNQNRGINTTGLQGVADVVRNRVLSDRFPDTVPEVLAQKPKGGAWQFSPMAPKAGGSLFANTPANEMATRVAESVLSGESPPVVGNSLNYGNLNTINNKPGYSSSKSKQAFNSMPASYTIADARNPSIAHTFGTQGRPSDVAFNSPGTYNPGFGGTQVAGIANAGLSQAAAQERARKEAEAARTMQGLANTKLPTDPRLSMPQGAYPAAPLRSAAGTYTDPYNPASQGPQRYSGPLDSIPSPQSIGMTAPASAFANDPRLNVPQGAYPARAQSMVAGDPRVGQTPLGGYPQARATSQVSTDPRVSQTPPGAFPAASKPASVFAEDPRLASPLGAYPAAPQKEVKVAWNVPPIGGAIGPAFGDAMSMFGANRPLPKGPAATPGTIHSQTAQTETAPSIWEQGSNWVKAKTGEVQAQIDEAKKTPGWKFAQEHPKLAAWAIKTFGGAGGAPRSDGLLGNPQDRSGRYFAPPQMPQPMQPQRQMAQAPAQDQLSQLLLMQEQMVASGADPEELAAIQALIDQLSTQEA